MSEKYASLSLDLDNKWCYLKTLGSDDWKNYPSYYELVVPRILDYLDSNDLNISFFIVGKDAELKENHPYLKMIVDSGHEIGSHSFMHDPWLQTYSAEELYKDLESADRCIQNVTGVKPIGFRGPGFSFSEETLRVLGRLDYKYDASVFANLLNSFARMYFFSKSDLTKEEKKKRSQLFGSWKDCLRSNKPFLWELDDCELLEIPVTTMPLFKIPIHVSYIIYLSQYSKIAAKLYFNMSLKLCVLTNTAPSILLHPLDFIDNDDDSDLSFFPAMDINYSSKKAVLDDVVTSLRKNFSIINMKDHYEIERRKDKLKTVNKFYI